MWRFLRNRRLLLCLHTIFRALIYWAHRAAVLAIAWHLVFVSSRRLYRLPRLTDFQKLYIKRHFSEKEVPFGGLRDEFSHFIEPSTLEQNYHDDWHATCKAMTIFVYPRSLLAADLDFWNLKVSQIGRPRKPHA